MRISWLGFLVCLCAGAVTSSATETSITGSLEPHGKPDADARLAQAEDDDQDAEFVEDEDDPKFVDEEPEDDPEFVEDDRNDEDDPVDQNQDANQNQTQPQDQNQNAVQQPATPPAQPAAGGSLQNQVLARHNQLRAQHCVPALGWSDRLAGIAQDWANRCVFEHRPGDLGENLAMGTSGAFPPASHVQRWYDEISSYDYATGQSRDGQPIGHFTQIVWRTTTLVGCAVATCSGQDLLVCNYSPAGNLTGTYRQNVPQRCR